MMKRRDDDKFGNIIDDNRIFKVESCGDSVAWSLKSSNQSKYKYSGCSGFKPPLGNRSAKKLWRAYRRRITVLAKKMAAMEKRPRWFMTLHY